MARPKKVVKLIHAYEMLDAIEKEKDEAKKKELIKTYGGVVPLNWIFSLNFRNDVILDLPEGMPPLDAKELDESKHPDTFGTLATQIHRLKYCVPSQNIPRFKKEKMFIEVILNCPLKDAEILCSAKDGALEELYPSITPELLASVYPDYVKQ